MFSSTISAVNGFSSSSTGAVAGVNKDDYDDYLEWLELCKQCGATGSFIDDSPDFSAYMFMYAPGTNGYDDFNAKLSAMIDEMRKNL